MSWLRAWIAAHPRMLVLALTHACALFLGGLIVHLRRPPQPAVQLTQTTTEKKDEQKALAKHEVRGPEDVVRRTFRPPPAGCPPDSPPVLASETTIHRAPSSADTTTKSSSTEQLDQRIDLRISPATPPRWSVGAGVESPLGAKQLRLEAGVRVLGPIWLKAGATPARGMSSATVGVEVQF